MTGTTIRLQGCRKAFSDGTVAVHDLNLTIEPGETLAILGPSGCGKTTTLRLIAGLERPDSGQIWFGDEDVTRVPIERRDVGMVFQNYA
ncbi:ATP-binding cassette domain-containing protein, partial [Pseudomonas gingeri]